MADNASYQPGAVNDCKGEGGGGSPSASAAGDNTAAAAADPSRPSALAVDEAVEESSAPPAAAATAAVLDASAGHGEGEIALQQHVVVDIVAAKRKFSTKEVSPALAHFSFFAPPLANGKNARCDVLVLQAVGGGGGAVIAKPCGELLTYKSGVGTGSLLRHLQRFHRKEHDACLQASKRSKRMKEKKLQMGSLAAAGAAGEAGSGSSSRYAPAFATGSTQTSEQPRSSATPGKPTPSRGRRSQNTNRTYTIMCAVDLLPPSVDEGLGYALHSDRFDSECASLPMSGDAFDATLLDICSETRSVIVCGLKAARHEYADAGYEGPFLALQLGMTGVNAMTEYCIAGVTLLRKGSASVVRYTLATRAFPASYTADDMQGWLEEVTYEYFEFLGKTVAPADVFHTATVNRGRHIIDALSELGIPTSICAAHRLNDSVVRGLGLNGSAATCGNPNGKHCVSRAVGLVSIFTHSACGAGANSGSQELRAILKHEVLLRRGVEELGWMEDFGDFPASEGSLNCVRLNDTRLASIFKFFEHAIHLRPVFDRYFAKKKENIARALSNNEWLAVRELHSLMDAPAEIGTRIQGGKKDASLSREMFLMTQLLDLCEDSEQEIMPEPAPAPEADGASSSSPSPSPSPAAVDTVNLTKPAFMFVRALAAEMRSRGLGTPANDNERIALLLNPTTMGCGRDVCIGGGPTEDASPTVRMQAIAALERFGDSLPPGPLIYQPYIPEPADAEPAAPATPAQKPPRSRLARLELARATAMRCGGAGSGGSGRGSGSALDFKGQLRKDLGAYQRMEQLTAGAEFDVIRYWRDKGAPKTDDTGRVLQPAQLPALAVAARLFLSVDSTSSEAERSFSSLALTVAGLRRSMRAARVDRMLFLRLNRGLIREVAQYDNALGSRARGVVQDGARKLACAHQSAAAGVVIKVP